MTQESPLTGDTATSRTRQDREHTAAPALHVLSASPDQSLKSETTGCRRPALRALVETMAVSNLARFLRTVEFLSEPSPAGLLSYLRDYFLNDSNQVDATSWQLLELDKVFLHTSGTHTAQRVCPSLAVAYQQFCTPPATELEWVSKQDAVQKLIADDSLFTAIQKLAETLDGRRLDRIFYAPGWGQTPAQWNAEVLDALKGIKRGMKDSPRTDVEYIDVLLDMMQEATNSHLFDLAEQGVAFSPTGIIPRSKGSFWRYVRPYAPFRSDPATIGITFGAAIGTVAMVPFAYQSVPGFLGFAGSLGLFFMGTMSIAFSRPSTALSKYFRSAASTDENISKFFEGLGRLQELIGWANFARNAKTPMCPSERNPACAFEVEASAMGNALQSTNSEYVLNTVEIDAQAIHALTGPNGGGKSQLQRSLAYNVWISEIAGIACAGRFRYTPPEKMIVHTPTVDNQSEGISRFQREVAELADAIGKAETAKRPVLLLLDEMFSSTAEDEAATEAIGQFAYLASLEHRPAVIIATHNRRLVGLLQKGGVARPLRMQWTGDKPSFILEEGVSETSYASSVVAAASIDRASLSRRLVNRGVGDPERFKELLEKMQ